MAREALGQDSLLGRRLGHYRILEEIGAGGMGVVYRAHDEHLDRDIAIKILPHGLLADATARQRFHKEAHALSKLNHPNIATVYDFDSCEGIDYLAEELVEGVSLDEMLPSGPLSEREIINLGTQLCEGLAAAHGHGILHRDIKPANLRVTAEGHLKILDFGLAKTVAVSGLAADEQATLSETQVVSGTLPYMSPEQLRNEKLDARMDIWAAGCVLYEMATGRRPFLGQGTAAVEEILHQAPAPPSKLNHKIVPGLEAIIQKCLEKDPERRYGSAHEISVDLHRLSTTATFIPAAGRRRAGWYWAWSLAVLMVIALIGVGIWKLLPPSSAMHNKSIAVLSFRNMSGDASLNWLGSGLPELLTTNLSQVKGMDVLSREQVFRAMKRKGQQDAPELPPDAALDVARDAGADTCVTGTLMKLGALKLRVDLHVQDTRTGKILFSDKVESEDINGIFSMVDAITARLAERALPVTQLPASTPQSAEVMTSNVEALRHYQAGQDYHNNAECEKAVAEYEEAVRLDPQFAMAYYRMAACYNGVDNKTKFLATTRLVERLSSRLPRVQQLMIQWWKAFRLGDSQGLREAAAELAQETPRIALPNLVRFEGSIWPDDPDRAVAQTRQASALDPNDPELYNQLAYAQARMGQEAAALEAWEQFRSYAGANPNVWDTHGDLLFTFGHDDEAVTADRRALEMDPDLQLRVRLALVYAEQGKYELAAQELNRYKQRKTGFYLLQFPAYEAELLQVEGMPEQSLALYANQVAAYLNLGQASDAGAALLRYATLALRLGKEQAALAFARQQVLPNKEEQITVSMLEAASGNEAGVQAALQQYAEVNPEVPARVIQAIRDWNTAIFTLRRADKNAATRLLPNLKLNSFPSGFYVGFLIRGRIRLLANDYAGAEQDFKLAITNLRLVRSLPQIPLTEQLSHFYLGQTYEQTGKRDDAIREYQKFLTPYAKSMSRLPQLAAARTALKRLHG